MASSYHSIYSGLWSDEDLEGTPFEEKGFFAFLCSNDHVRASGIYRMSDEQLAADTGLPERRVKIYLSDLQARRRIVRDASYLFIRGYFRRQPKHDNLLKAAAQQVSECSSVAILEAWSEKYPAHSQWSADRLATLAQRSPNGQPTVHTTVASYIRLNQIRLDQSTVDQPTVVDCLGPEAGPRPTLPPSFQIPESIVRALDRAPRLGGVPRIRSPEFWQAEVRANGRVDLGAEVLKAEAWMVANQHKAKRDLPRFLHNWLTRAAEGSG